MNAGTYRESRVRVSLKVKETLLELMRREDDTSQKKKHPAKWYRGEVVKKLHLTADDNPSLRSYEVVINDFRNKFKVTNPLDEQWHLGTLLDYPISPEAVAKIINFKLKAQAIKADWVTIRTALWMARLSALPLSLDNLNFFAEVFALQEEMRELVGSEYDFNTNTDAVLLRLLNEQPDDLLKEVFEPVTDEQRTEFARFVAENVTPEKQKEMAEKIKRHRKEKKQ